MLGVTMKLLLKALVVLFAFAAGGYGGYWYATKSAEGAFLAFDMLEHNYYLSFSSVQMANGTDATREKVIRSHLALMEKHKVRPSIFFTDESIAFDSALAYARLSALAKRQGSTLEAQQLLDRAVSYCPKLGWSKCDSEKILSAVQQLDKQNIFGSGTK
jgi:hypothetical protein